MAIIVGAFVWKLFRQRIHAIPHRPTPQIQQSRSVVIGKQAEVVDFFFSVELEFMGRVSLAFDTDEVHPPGVVVVFLDLLFEDADEEVIEVRGGGVFFVKADFDVAGGIGGEVGLQELPFAGGNGVGQVGASLRTKPI